MSEGTTHHPSPARHSAVVAPLPGPRGGEPPPTDEERAVLRRRARELAAPLRAVDDAAGGTAIECVVFQLGGQSFAVEASSVKDAVIPATITPLPGLPETLRGLVNVRSRIVPAFDARSLLNVKSRADGRGRETLLIVVCGNAEFGLLVDQLSGVRRIDPARLRADIAALQTEYLRGMADDGLLLVDLSAITAALTIGERQSSV